MLLARSRADGRRPRANSPAGSRRSSRCSSAPCSAPVRASSCSARPHVATGTRIEELWLTRASGTSSRRRPGCSSLLMIGLRHVAARRRGGRAGSTWAPITGVYAGIGAAMLVSSLVYFLPPNARRCRRASRGSNRRSRRASACSSPTSARRMRRRRRPSAVYLREFLWRQSRRRSVALAVVRDPQRHHRAAAMAHVRRAPTSGSGRRARFAAVCSTVGRSADSPGEAASGTTTKCCLAMRYGNPSIRAGIDHLACLRAARTSSSRRCSRRRATRRPARLQAEVARVAGQRRDAPALQFVGARLCR